MPDPTLNSQHVNRPLTNQTVARIQADERFVAGAAAPSVPVKSKSDSYFVFNQGDYNRIEMRRRGPSTRAARSGFTLSTDTYNCDRWAVARERDRVEASGIDSPPLRAAQNDTDWVTNQMKLKMEDLWSATFFQPATWTTDWDGVSSGPSTNEILQWDQTGSTPLQDVESLKAAMDGLGVDDSNLIMVVGRRVHKILVAHAEVADRMDSLGLSGENRQYNKLAEYFGVNKYLVNRAAYNTAARSATASWSHFGSDNDVWLGYVAPSPGLEVESAGYTYAWTSPAGSSRLGTRIRRWYDPDLDSDVTEGELFVDMKVVSADCGAFIDAAVAAAA